MERDPVYVGQLRAVPIRPGMFLHDFGCVTRHSAIQITIGAMASARGWNQAFP